MRYCQSCALENEWPMPVGAQLTVIGKCDACGKITPCVVAADHTEAQSCYPGTDGKYDGIECTCTNKCGWLRGACGCEACTGCWLDSADELG